MTGLKLSKAQYGYFAVAFRTISEGIILGSSGAFFLPETFQLQSPILLSRYILLLLSGLIILIIGAMLQNIGDKND